MKKVFSVVALLLSFVAVMAQDREEDEKKPFKENLFTGGSVSLAFYNNTFLIGASPVFGYSLTEWADAGIVVNYNYTAYRDVYTFDDRLRQKVYGGGAFVKLYPVRFLFAQGQIEHNFITQKYIPVSGASTNSETINSTSYLIGGGYTSGREGRGGEPFYYLALLFDVSGNINSPYTDAYGRSIPIIRAGLQVPLFQGGGGRRRGR
jgi:hypothetical protein